MLCGWVNNARRALVHILADGQYDVFLCCTAGCVWIESGSGGTIGTCLVLGRQIDVVENVVAWLSKSASSGCCFCLRGWFCDGHRFASLLLVRVVDFLVVSQTTQLG